MEQWRPIQRERVNGVIYLVWNAALLTLFSLSAGCATPETLKSPTAAGLKPSDLVHSPEDIDNGSTHHELHQFFELGERVRESQRPEILPPKKSVLVLSGGGAFGAYSAGILCGWSEAGTRPTFDTVTGVSTGALVAVFAFLGPEYDDELRQSYTEINSAGIYHAKPLFIALFSDSLNDSKPLLKQIEETITPEVVSKLAEAHKEGRRLYVGTTDLDGRRAVVWDLSAIAASGKPESRELICKLLLASAAIPAFFPAVEIPIHVDGKKYVERHVDGGLTQPLFFRPPHMAEENRRNPLPTMLYGSDEYVIVAGKLYADPYPVKPQVLPIVGSTVTTFLHAQTRDTLVKLYMQSMLTGMRYHLAAVPSDFAGLSSPIDFNPAGMTKLFEEGRKQALDGTVWRNMPPGIGEREELHQRTGTSLTLLRHHERKERSFRPDHLIQLTNQLEPESDRR
ncbi:patatin-like phospholipase family protein [bacterium]|nr:patatin-like phospholipase family protein [bacterium]